MTPALLFLVYRQKTGCRQYSFESIEDAEKFGSRKPYCDELLTVHVGVQCKPEITMYVPGRSLGEALRVWFAERFPTSAVAS